MTGYRVRVRVRIEGYNGSIGHIETSTHAGAYTNTLAYTDTETPAHKPVVDSSTWTHTCMQTQPHTHSHSYWHKQG